MKQEQLQMTKELRQINNKVLKGLHDVLAIDFEADFQLYKVQLPKTINAIIKEYQLTNNTLNYLLIQREPIYNNKPEFNLVEIFSTGTYEIDFKSLWNSGLDKYYRKLDFEKDRKSDKNCFLLVAPANTKKEYFKVIKEGNLKNNYYNDINNLYRYVYEDRHIKACGMGNHTFVEYGVSGGMILGTNKNYNIDITYNYHDLYRNNTSKITEIIDKSGYNVYAKRQELKRKANELKSERAKNEILNSSFDSENENLKNSINQAKELVTMQLAGKNIFDEQYKEILKEMDKLYYIAKDFNRHIERLNQTKNENADSYYWYNYNNVNDIKKTINDLQEKVNKITTVYNS